MSGSLPEPCGRARLRSASFEMLAEKAFASDRLGKLQRLVATNGPKATIANDWLNIAQGLDRDRLDYWFSVGADLQLFGNVSEDGLGPLFGTETSGRIALLVGSGHNKHYQRTTEIEQVAESEVLDIAAYRGALSTSDGGRLETLCGLLSMISGISVAIPPPRYRGFSGMIAGMSVAHRKFRDPAWLEDEDGSDLARLCNVMISLLKEPIDIWHESFAPWQVAISMLEDAFGHRPAIDLLAIEAAQTVSSDSEAPTNETLAVAHRLYSHRHRQAVWRKALEGQHLRLAVSSYLIFCAAIGIEEHI